MTSTTFIRREIYALERQGVEVVRYGVRHWDGPLIDPDDLAERERTKYLMTGNLPGLIFALLSTALTNPAGLFRTLKPWFQLVKAARGKIIPHIAYLMQAAALTRHARKDGISHVHVHFGTNATAVAMLARHLGGPSYSFMVHGPDELTDPSELNFPIKIKHAKFVTAITHFCRSQLIRFSSVEYADKIKIIHCALNLEDFTQTPLPQNRNFVCIGRLCPQKGQAMIPRVVAKLVADYPDVKIQLVGDGETRPEIEAEIARLNLDDNFELMGWRTSEEVRQILQNARHFLLPSFAEGLPVVLMEAYALGRPSISTYIAGIPELIDDSCGWLIPAGSEEALETAMRDAMEAGDDRLNKMAQIGRARVEASHDADIEAAKLKELILAD